MVKELNMGYKTSDGDELACNKIKPGMVIVTSNGRQRKITKVEIDGQEVRLFWSTNKPPIHRWVSDTIVVIS